MQGNEERGNTEICVQRNEPSCSLKQRLFVITATADPAVLSCRPALTAVETGWCWSLCSPLKFSDTNHLTQGSRLCQHQRVCCPEAQHRISVSAEQQFFLLPV